MIKTKLSWDRIRQHFSYLWWAYAVMAGLLLFVWSMWYNITEYEPPADKKLQITLAGDYVSQTVLEYYTAEALAEFPALEKVTVDNIPLDFTGEGDYSGYQKLQVVIAVGEGDIYLLSGDQLRIYADMGAFTPLDDLVAEGGALHGMFTEEEIRAGTFTITEGDGEPHLYGIPADRLYGLLSQGVNTKGMYVTMTTFTGNPEYAQKALIWLCEQTQEQPPAWMDEYKELEEAITGTTDENLPEIG